VAAHTKARRPVKRRRGADRRLAAKVLRALKKQIPAPRCELDHRNAWELLVATILSAQSTDRMVNKVTPQLFARFPTPAALGQADPAEVESIVKPTGFFRMKARSIQEASRQIAEGHGGEVPRDVEALCHLRGVARKTANVVLGTAFGIAAGIVVDTHAQRVSQRLGLTAEKDPGRIEEDLMRLFPREEWIDLGHRLVLHGRYTCLARAPRCNACACRPFCPSAKEFAG
jgi:endonuclease-3